MSSDPRFRAQRRRDTEHRLTHDADVWVSASADGAPYLVPLSFDWGGEAASRVVFNLPARAARPGGRLWVIASGATRPPLFPRTDADPLCNKSRCRPPSGTEPS
jgi:hypothetical protein